MGVGGTILVGTRNVRCQRGVPVRPPVNRAPVGRIDVEPGSSSSLTPRWRETDTNSPSHPRGVGTCSEFSQRVGDLNITPQQPRALEDLGRVFIGGEDLRRSPAPHGRCPQPRFWRIMYVARPCVPPAGNI